MATAAAAAAGAAALSKLLVGLLPASACVGLVCDDCDLLRPNDHLRLGCRSGSCRADMLAGVLLSAGAGAAAAPTERAGSCSAVAGDVPAGAAAAALPTVLSTMGLAARMDIGLFNKAFAQLQTSTIRIAESLFDAVKSIPVVEQGAKG